MSMKSIIVAKSENGVIGKDNELPWYLPDDLKYFKQLTRRHSVIMGRKTFDSILARIQRPLPERQNIVLTRNPLARPLGAVAVGTIQDAFEAAESDDVFVLGGEEVYRQTLPIVDRLYITEVHTNIDGDAFFPDPSPTEWKEVSRQHHAKDKKHQFDFDFVIYDRQEAGNQ